MALYLKDYYAGLVTHTITLASLATSSTFVAGREGNLIDNTTNLYTDAQFGLRFRVGTTPTANTYIRLYFAAQVEDTLWPDVLDGTDSAETFTSTAIRDACCRLAGSILVPVATSDIDYWLAGISIRRVFGFVPRKFVPFVSHSTVANANSIGSNFGLFSYPKYLQLAA